MALTSCFHPHLMRLPLPPVKLTEASWLHHSWVRTLTWLMEFSQLHPCLMVFQVATLFYVLVRAVYCYTMIFKVFSFDPRNAWLQSLEKCFHFSCSSSCPFSIAITNKCLDTSYFVLFPLLDWNIMFKQLWIYLLTLDIWCYEILMNVKRVIING